MKTPKQVFEEIQKKQYKHSKAIKLVQLYQKVLQEDECGPFEKYLISCDESDLREAFGNNKNALINIIFCGFGDAFDYVSEDFIKEMFVDIDDRDREWLEQYLHDVIYHIADDIFKDNKNTIKYFAKYVNWLQKIRNYIKYCNPENTALRKEYIFIWNEVFWYMNMEE